MVLRSQSETPTPAEYRSSLNSDCNGDGFADENNISIHPGFGKCAGECDN